MGGFPQKWRRGCPFVYSLCIPSSRHTRQFSPSRIAGVCIAQQAWAACLSSQPSESRLDLLIPKLCPNPLSLIRFASKSFVSGIVEELLIQIDEGMFV
jgi:hypothetical protein